MKKTIFLMLMAMAGAAHAGYYEEYNNKLNTCAAYGDTGDLYYRMALQGKRPTLRNSDAAEPVRQHIEDEIYGHTEQYDRYSARSMAASYCMDHIDRYAREAHLTQ